MPTTNGVQLGGALRRLARHRHRWEGVSADDGCGARAPAAQWSATTSSGSNASATQGRRS